MADRTGTTGRRWRYWGIGALLLAVSACSADGPEVSSSSVGSPSTTGPRSGGGRGPRVGAFQPFADCAEFLDYVQTEALERVGPYGLGGGYGIAVAEGGRDVAAEEAAPTAGDGGKVGVDYSGTNVQEQGVDEGDVVETDGRYVYSVLGPALVVTDLDQTRVVDTVELGGWGSHQLLLDVEGDRLAVVSQGWSGNVSDVVVTLYDVSDPGDLRRVHRTHLEGVVVAARSVGGTARLVVTTPLGSQLPFVQPGFAIDEDEAVERNRQIIRASSAEDWLPRRFSEERNGSFGPVTAALDCAEIGNPEQFSGLGIAWVATLDLRGADAEPVGAAGVVATGEQVYASGSSLYVATVPWDWQVWRGDGREAPSAHPPTAIHQFDLGAPDGADYLASGTVKGYLLNSYAMSEYDGVLRVATTVWAEGFGTQQESGVHTFRREGDRLVELGAVTGLGKDEQIHAVRFLGELGYVVTFRQVDPLYVVDLRDPSRPTVAGELKIPGFSSYLAPVADGFLVGVGADATEDGRVTGGQLSLFDVRDPQNPKRVSTVSIGSGQSEVGWDPHAFLYWPADGTIVVPTSQGWQCPVDRGCPGGYDGSNAAFVARYADGTLGFRGAVTHPKDAIPHDVWCWYGPGIRRSLVSGDRLVTLSERGLLVSGLADLADRAWIPFGTSQDPCRIVEG